MVILNYANIKLMDVFSRLVARINIYGQGTKEEIY